jgi:hypothetical protein
MNENCSARLLKFRGQFRALNCWICFAAGLAGPNKSLRPTVSTHHKLYPRVTCFIRCVFLYDSSHALLDTLSHPGAEVIQFTKMTPRLRRAAQNREGISVRLVLPGTHALSGRVPPMQSRLTSRLFIMIIKGSSTRLLGDCGA